MPRRRASSKEVGGFAVGQAVRREQPVGQPPGAPRGARVSGKTDRPKEAEERRDRGNGKEGEARRSGPETALADHVCGNRSSGVRKAGSWSERQRIREIGR